MAVLCSGREPRAADVFQVVAHAIDVSIEGIVTQAYGPSSSSLALEMLTRILG